jgi:trk system potassium uptake protein TrkH
MTTLTPEPLLPAGLRRRSAGVWHIPRLRPIGFVLGLFLLTLAVTMLIPALADIRAGHPDWHAFFNAAAITALVGGTLVLANRSKTIELELRQAFFLTVSAWLAMSAFGALPFMFAGLQLNYADAVFETVSGLTTTGSTILVGLDRMPPGILLWRGLLQWLGGIGIIVMAVAMLPFLRVGGMQLFRMESSDRTEKPLPRLVDMLNRIALLYVGLTIACALAYWLAGMSGFEAGVHAMTTISTGGYSTTDASMGHFPGPAILWISVVFMTTASLPFALMVHSLHGSGNASIWRDQQVHSFLGFLGAIWLVMAFWLSLTSGRPFFDVLTVAAFNLTSVITTTGYASEDYSLWGNFAVVTFLVLTFVGGCTGSTAGGIKIYRFVVLFSLYGRLMRGLIRPHGVHLARYNRRQLGDTVVASVLTFLVLYVLTVTLLTIGLTLLDLDFLTSLTGAATAVGNVGPGLGPIIGPAGNFSTMPDSAKWLLSFGMLAGRLELLTVMVLFSPAFWRD